ncbi:MAG: hypothetical protein FWD98_08825, partial [Defluviitaleaceae bacterium]|nr:hypothetical protein [Defluviitaleaceae bacterium]
AICVVGVMVLASVLLFAVANGIIGLDIEDIPGVTVITAENRTLAEKRVFKHALAAYWFRKAAFNLLFLTNNVMPLPVPLKVSLRRHNKREAC